MFIINIFQDLGIPTDLTHYTEEAMVEHALRVSAEEDGVTTERYANGVSCGYWQGVNQ